MGIIKNDVITINAWNTEGEETSFDCDINTELYGHYLRHEPIAVLALIDKQARWNQELENVYLVACETKFDDRGHHYQHYIYELRPDDCF